MNKFENAQEAFEFYYDEILNNGIDFDGTKALFNIGFEILNPMDNKINTPWRKWKNSYAIKEWEWYLSGDKSALEISKFASIWKNMMDENGEVQSNYGWQWNRNNQLNKIIEKLKSKPNTRHAVLTIYDGKEIENYKYDTPCTLNIGFQIINNKLNMTVTMRSNDLIYGFCNDQYCFSKLQEMVANELNLEVGTYFHFVFNLHIYYRHFKLKEKYNV
jgi:thymidylate synthase